MKHIDYLNKMILSGGGSGGGYPEPTGTKQITQNGTNIDVKDYAKADVNVPNSYAVADEGKVVSNGELVSQSSQSVTQNGTYDTTLKNEVVVNVSSDSDRILREILDYNDQNVETVFTVPSDITNLRNAALRNIKAYTISGAGVVDVGTGCAQGNSYVKHFNFPNATIIRESGIRDNTALETVYAPLVEETNNQNFNGMGDLVELNLPSLTKTGTYNFRSGNHLEKIVIPKLKVLNDNCFGSLPLLVNLSLPACTQIKTAIAGCAALANLFLPGSTLASRSNTSSFNNTPISSGTGTIWVNDDLVDQYKAATNWSTFASQIRKISEYTGSFNYNEGVE